jgi:hypothetical protein
MCKGTSARFLTFPLYSSTLLYSPLLSHTHPCSYVHSPTLCTITRCQVLNANNSRTSKTSTRRLLLSSTSYPSPPLLPLKLQTSFGHIGIGPRNTMAPSAITWTPIFSVLFGFPLARQVLYIIFTIPYIFTLDFPWLGKCCILYLPSLIYLLWISLS